MQHQRRDNDVGGSKESSEAVETSPPKYQTETASWSTTEQTTKNVRKSSSQALESEPNDEYNLSGIGTGEIRTQKRRRRHRGRGGKGQRLSDGTVSDIAAGQNSASTSLRRPEQKPGSETQHQDLQSSISTSSGSSSGRSKVFSSDGSSAASDSTVASNSSVLSMDPEVPCFGHTNHPSTPYGLGTRTPTQETFNRSSNNLCPDRPSLHPMGSDHPAGTSQDSLVSIYSQGSTNDTDSSFDHNEGQLDEQYEDIVGMIEQLARETLAMEGNDDRNFVRYNLGRVRNSMLQHHILIRAYCAHKDRRIRTLERELSYTESLHQQSEVMARELEDELRNATAILRDTDRRAAEADVRVERYEEQIDKLSKEHRIVKNELMAAHVGLSELGRFREMPKLLDSIREELTDAHNVNSDLKLQICDKHVEIEELSRQITTSQRDNSLLQERCRNTASELKTARDIILISERSSANSLAYREDWEATSHPDTPISATSAIDKATPLDVKVGSSGPADVEKKPIARSAVTIGRANLAGALRWVVKGFTATTDGGVWDMKFPEYVYRGMQKVNTAREVKDEVPIPVTSLSMDDGHTVTAVEEESDNEPAVTPSTSPTTSDHEQTIIESEVTDIGDEDTIVVAPTPLSSFGQVWEVGKTSIVFSASVPPCGRVVRLLWRLFEGLYWPILLFMWLQVWEARSMWLDANSNEDRNDAIWHAREYKMGHPLYDHALLVLIDRWGLTREVFEE
jgi:hypothetical protein